MCLQLRAIFCQNLCKCFPGLTSLDRWRAHRPELLCTRKRGLWVTQNIGLPHCICRSVCCIHIISSHYYILYIFIYAVMKYLDDIWYRCIFEYAHMLYTERCSGGAFSCVMLSGRCVWPCLAFSETGLHPFPSMWPYFQGTGTIGRAWWESSGSKAHSSNHTLKVYKSPRHVDWRNVQAQAERMEASTVN